MPVGSSCCQEAGAVERLARSVWCGAITVEGRPVRNCSGMVEQWLSKVTWAASTQHPLLVADADLPGARDHPDWGAVFRTAGCAARGSHCQALVGSAAEPDLLLRERLYYIRGRGQDVKTAQLQRSSVVP